MVIIMSCRPKRFAVSSERRILLLLLLALPLFSSGGHAAPELAQLKQYSLEELMDLQVTSVSRSPIQIAKAPSAIQVITNWDIRRSGAVTLPEALRLAGNLQVAQKNSHDWGISARGFNADLGNKLLVMVDGRAVYTPLWSGVRWDVQDYLLEDVDRIEVVSGPGGSVWGANAVNGVINVTTKPAGETQGLYAEGGMGGQLENFLGFRWGGKLDPRVSYRVYFKHLEIDDETLQGGASAGDALNVDRAGFRLDADLEAAGILTFQGDYYGGTEGVVGSGEGKVEGGNLLGRWTKTLGNGSDLVLQLYYDRAFLRLPVPESPLGAAGKFFDDLETYDIDFQHRLSRLGPHALTWGVGYRTFNDQSTTAPALGFSPATSTQSLYSGFVQDQIALGRSRTLTLGTKLEHTDYTGFEMEPSIRLQQELASGDLIWGAVSRAVRTPSRIDRDIRQPGVGQPFLSGNPSFTSESVVAYELGFRGKIYQRLTGSLSIFHNDYSDVRSVAPSPPAGLPLVIRNDLEGSTDGAELAFDAQVRRGWRIHGSYTLLRRDLRVRPGRVDVNNALNETADPDHQFLLGSSVDLPGGIELDLHYRWVDSLEVNNGGVPATVPSYSELDARIGYELSMNLSLSIVGQNLLHEKHAEAGLPGVNQVQLRRSVFARITWRY
jgi:iron complex outermembrane receptor protein